MESVKHLGMIKRALRYFQQTRRNTITQAELIGYMTRTTGCSDESVQGTIIGGGTKKLFDNPIFKRDWMVCSAHVLTGRVKRFVRRNAADKNDIEAVIDYNSPNKKEARERGLKHLKPGPQKIITLAGTEGYCVKIMLARCPEAEITNIEHDPAILAEWKKKKIPTHDFLGDLHKFLKSTAFAKNQYSLFNADLMGYACNTLNADLIRVNEMANVNIIVLTLLNIKKFRNTGHWVQWARKHYHSDDPTREWLVDIMDHYTIIDEWDYIREPEKHSRSMRMFVLRRRKL